MEYIFGATLSDLLIEGKVGSTEVIDMVVNHYQYQYGNRKTSNDFLYKYDQKINHLNKLKNKYNNFYNLHYSLDLLNSDDWMSGYITYVHGDMTFENVIKCRHTGDMYLIDFLDDFSDNLYTDLSKIFQDLIGQWSFINKSNFLIKKTDVNYAIKLLDIRKNIIGSISSIDDDTDWIKKTMYGLLLNYVRIIPYVKNNKMLEHTDRLLGQAIDIIEKDDYINQLT